jgi:MHS family alpha-ketoglutarate permease-like MFS transporter
MSTTDDITPASVLSRGDRRRALLGTGLGNALEWFDWNIYAVFSVALAGSFFADGEGSSGLLHILLVFAIGFFFRPLGGLVLAAAVDRIGRRRGLALMVGLMALGCLLVAAAPSYEQIGIGAPIILVVARVTQGLSAGGEFAAASTYLAEVAPRRPSTSAPRSARSSRSRRRWCCTRR